MDDAFMIEVETIHLVMEQLDYYQLLKVARDASAGDIQRAFFAESRTFHPDRYFGVNDDTFKDRVLEIYKRLAEAYGVLKEPESRSYYDQQLDAQGVLRLDRSAFERGNRNAASPEAMASTQNGRKFLMLGLESGKSGDLKAAVMNLQFALSAEPNNEYIKEQLERARALAGNLKKDASNNAYRLRMPS